MRRPPTTREILRRLVDAAHAYDAEFFCAGAMDELDSRQTRAVDRLYRALDAADEHIKATARKTVDAQEPS